MVEQFIEMEVVVISEVVAVIGDIIICGDFDTGVGGCDCRLWC